MNATPDALVNDRRGSLLDDAVANAEPVPAANAPTHLPRLGDLAAEALATMFRRLNGEEKAIETPWPSVNKALGGGLWPGLHVLVSSTGAGKTQLAMQLAVETAKTGRPVVYVALELGPVDLVARVLAYLASERDRLLKWSDLVCGRTERLASVVATHEATLRALPFHVLVTPPRGWDPAELRGMATAYPGALVVVDYLQLVRGASREDLRHTIGRASYELRAAARDHGCTVLAISSTARAGYGAATGQKEAREDALGEGDPGRFVGMGKESGDIEFACDSVLFLACEPYQAGQMRRPAHLAIAKNRVGGPAWARLDFVEGTRFEEPKYTVQEQVPGVGRS